MDGNGRVLGQRLRAMREARYLSQRELAARVGVSRTSIQLYEYGRKTPRLTTLNALCKALDTNANYLLGTSDEPGEAWHTKLALEHKEVAR